ncbi:leucine-rich repeat domain-containing protein [Mameliella sp.]|uniref:leucine-rich repeat domain-containing protein n=1 Tax=Mameliella sp. TaxID=1924940 RepID=UPI003B500255
MLRKLFIALSIVAGSVAGTAGAQDCLPIGDSCISPEDRRIVLGPAELVELPKLAGATWVQSLELAGNGDPALVVDLAALNVLKDLGHLRVQDLPGARWDDLDLPALQALRLQDNDITDFTFLDGLPALRALWLKDSHGLSDLPRATLGRVENLRLNGPDLHDIRADGAMTNLKILGFNDVSLPDLSGLGPTPALELLNIEGEDITSLDGLIVGPAFRELWAEGASLTDISALAPAENLEMLRGKNSRIGDISALAGKTKLQTLFLTGSQVSDLSPLAGLQSLQLLSFSDTPVTDISALSNLPELVAIYMNVTQVTDFTPLLDTPTDIMLRINSDRILMSSKLPGFIAEEGWKRGPLYEE